MVSPLQIVQPGQTRTRKKRSPSFPFAGSMKPFGLYPIWAHPVLPGETMNMAETKYRLISLPVKHPLTGAWFETWTAFCSLTDLNENFAQMFISEDVSPVAYQAGADRPRYFTKAGQIDYIKLAMDSIVKNYFRDEEEPDWDTHLIDGVHMAKRTSWDWAQNLMFKPAALDAAFLPSALPEDGTLTPLEIMRLSGMSEITYEKYLMQYGVAQKEAVKEARIPEILRYTREWTTPSNSIEPTTGRPSSAFSWSATLKAEKPKRFDEPGFIITFGCVRPKMFDSTLRASMIGELWGFGDFFPVYNLADPAAGLKVLDADHKVLALTAGVTDPLMYDHRDLLSHGEQFVNDWSGPYALPTVSARTLVDGSELHELRGQYPTLANINALFVEDEEETPNEAKRRLFYEGIASVEVTGHVADTTR